MALGLGPITLIPGVAQTISFNNVNAVSAAKVTNGTPFDITYSGFGVQGVSVIPAGTEYMLYASIFNSGTITLLAVNNTGVTGNGVANIVLFFVGEEVPPGVWPITVPTQVVHANLAASTNLTNTGNPPLTNVISIVPSDAAATWTADNSGNLTIYGDNAGVRSLLLALLAATANGTVSVQISDIQHTTEIMGALQVDANATFNGYVDTPYVQMKNFTTGGEPRIMTDTVAGGALIIQMPNGTDAIRLETDGSVTAMGTKLAGFGSKGVKRSLVDDTGTIVYHKAATGWILQIPNGTSMVDVEPSYNHAPIAGQPCTMSIAGDLKLGTNNSGLSSNLFYGDGSKQGSTHIGTGTVTGTYSHGCNKAPQFIAISISAVGSATTGYDTVTATQFHATIAAVNNFTFEAHTYN